MQRAGATITLATITADTADPSGNDGALVSLFGYGDKAPDAINLTIEVSGTTPSGVLELWGRSRVGQIWGPGGENDGKLNFGEPITRSCHLTIRDVAALDSLAINASSVSGTNPEFVVHATALFNEAA